MGKTINLYSQSGDEHELNKSLTAIGTYTCDIKAPIDIENPEITISGAHTNANYAYIADFGRYYFLTPIGKNNSITTYQGKSDVLMSFKTGIKASPAVISRNPWHFDLYVPDNKLPIEARSMSSILNFTQNPFSGSDNCYILTTIGSGGT